MALSNQGSRQDWSAFWADKSSPKWAQDTENYYQLYAGELRLLYQDRQPRRVLELGCGSGSLYPYLGFEAADYKGVDFSASMLAAFRAAHPDVELAEQGGEKYRDNSVYDVIFSNGLIQYFDPAMLDSHFTNARSMMSRDSLLICGSVPWTARRLGYCRAAFGPKAPRSIVRGLLTLGKYVLHKDPVGHWYSLADFRALARRHGMQVRFHGSPVHLYRFHAALTLA